VVGSAGPANVLPPLAGQGPQTAAIPGSETKRVRTVVIRPDQPNGTPTPAPARVTPVAPQMAAPVTPRAMPAPAPQMAARPAPDSAAEAGGYVVQVASQRSEADAQASYRMLQTKYPGVLGSRRAMIKRADLGDRGVYYRAQVGPFGSAEEAGEMCTSLKAAGGQCIVQRN
jgi:cell division septation protein DedD